MPSRFEKFSERARRVLSLAQEEAQRFNHNYIGTEHLLLGLIRETDGVAGKVLTNLGVELSKIRSAIEFIGTEHLLAGLMLEDEGVAPQVLQSLGVTLDKVRSEITNVRNLVQS